MAEEIERLCVLTADGVTTDGMRLTAPSGENVELRVKIPRSCGVKEAKLLIKNDEEDHFNDYALPWARLDGDFDIYETRLPVNEVGLYWFYVKFRAFGGDYLVCRNGAKAIVDHVYEGFASFQFTVYDKEMTTPDFIKGGVFYHIFVDRFYKGESQAIDDKPYNPERPVVRRDDWGAEPEWRPDENGEILNNDFFGGNIAGIREKLPYLNDLGVTCLYLSPIFEAYSNHKYDTSDYSKIDSIFGNEEEFRSLCDEAARLGIRVILDGVFNHTGADSIYFNKFGTYGKKVGAYNDFNSPYHNWYNFIVFPRVYSSWWGITTLPTVNKDDKNYRAYMFGENGIIRKWLRAGASGYRLDVADELSDDFLAELKSAARTEKQDALVLGEVWEDASNKSAYGKRKHYFQGHELDSVMNYPLKDSIVDFVRRGNAESLAFVVESELENYPSDVIDCLMNNLGTHDTARILTVLGGRELPNDASREERHVTKMAFKEFNAAIELLKIAVFLQMTLPGVPCIYYGDEAGMEGYNDPFNRGCFPWGNENMDLTDFYKKMIKIRRSDPVFKHSETKVLYAKDSIFIFERSVGKEKYIIGVNRSYFPVKYEIIDFDKLSSVQNVMDGYSDVESEYIIILPYGKMMLKIS